MTEQTGTRSGGASTAEVVVRRAVRFDARELAGMRWDRTAEETDLDPQDREDFLDRRVTWFADALEDGWAVWVAEEDGRLRGQVFLRVVQKVPSPVNPHGALGYLSNLWVAPELRRRGLAGRLLEAAREWAQFEPLDLLVVWPTPQTQALLDQAGFRGSDVLHLPLHR